MKKIFLATVCILVVGAIGAIVGAMQKIFSDQAITVILATIGGAFGMTIIWFIIWCLRGGEEIYKRRMRKEEMEEHYHDLSGFLNTF